MHDPQNEFPKSSAVFDLAQLRHTDFTTNRIASPGGHPCMRCLSRRQALLRALWGWTQRWDYFTLTNRIETASLAT